MKDHPISSSIETLGPQGGATLWEGYGTFRMSYFAEGIDLLGAGFQGLDQLPVLAASSCVRMKCDWSTASSRDF